MLMRLSRLGVCLLLSLSYLSLQGCSSTRHAGKVSDHFDGERFFNPGQREEHGFSEFLRWRWSREPGSWPDGIAPRQERQSPPARITEGVRVTFINHTTFLIQLPGLNILTDPIWSERASPLAFAGPRRRVEPGLRFEQLPPIDLVLISHNHYDHMDLPTLELIAARDHPKVFVPLGNRTLLEGIGLSDIVELDWWQQAPLSAGASLTLVPATHFSARTPFDRNRSLWGGFYLQQGVERIYFAGDTGRGDHFAAIRQRLGPPTLAMLPIGAYKPRWFMAPVHLSPAEAVEAHHILAAETTIPMHYGTFPLADDAMDDPLDALRAALEREPAAFRQLALGESYQSAPVAVARSGDGDAGEAE